MNVEGAKIGAIAPSKASVEAGGQALSEPGAMPEGFADALTEQLKLASEAKDQDALPKPLQQLATGENLNRLHSIADLLGSQGAAQELAALFGKDLPMSYKVSEEADIEDTLSTLTEALKDVSIGSAAVQDDQINLGQAVAGSDALPAESNNPVVSAETMAVIKELLGAAFFSGQQGDNSTESMESGDLAPLKIPLTAANHPAETVQPKGLGGGESSDDVSSKDNVFRQILQDGQETAGLRKAALLEKMAQAGQVADTEGSLSRVAADIVQPSKQLAENRVEVPTIARPVGHPEWNRDLGERIIWMHNKAMPTAEIKLNPQHLGPITVRIDMSQDQATVTFTTQHAAVREALEASVPRLREMMNAQQINLADVNVFEHSAGQKQSQSQGYGHSASDWEQGAGGRVEDGMVDLAGEIGSHDAVVSKGLLSIYA